ncbi:MAG: SsrA-binding protein SmpB [Chloroflexi bacterium]|nr:SsrA-binding protein SmpB [Chloroflexota bacterium]
MGQAGEKVKVVATNRKAFHDYTVEDTFEAGIALVGSEIKSVREGRVNLRDGFAGFSNGELWLQNCHISTYDPASRDNHDPTRRRKLLMHRRELNRLAGRVQEKGLTIVPLRMYLKRGRAKVEIALVRGKKLYDKRETIAKRDAERQIEREVRRGWRE